MKRLLLLLLLAVATTAPPASAVVVTQKADDALGLIYVKAVFQTHGRGLPLPAGELQVGTVSPLPCGVAAFSCSDRSLTDRIAEIGYLGPHPVVSFQHELGIMYADQSLTRAEEQRSFAAAIGRPRFNLARFADVYAWCATFEEATSLRYYFQPNGGKLRGWALLRGCAWLRARAG